MKTTERRTYISPVRAAQARATRERILAAVAEWMAEDSGKALTLEGVARAAGVERRTLFRHFSSREELLAAFWTWINARITPRTLPEGWEELVAAPRDTFKGFDRHEGVIRASLHSAAGRAMRMAAAEERRQAFRRALGEVTRGVPAGEKRRLLAVVHALYSAAAWEAMRDYAGVSGAEAGEAAAWALGVLVKSVRRTPGAGQSSS